MRIPTAFIRMFSLSLSLAALAACSDGSGSAPVPVDAAGKHAVAAGYATWVQQHWVEYKKENGGSSALSSATGCSECHGADLSGGISKVSCFSASFKNIAGVASSCHPNGDRTLGHPSSWIDPTSAGFHAAATFNGAAVRGSAALGAQCGPCHATDANTLSLGSAPSCLSKDPKWGISCHATSPAVASVGCVSCHDVPPDGAAGSAAPNRAGAHAAHLALGVGCNACHHGGGTGTGRHGVGNGLAYLNLSTGYKAQTGAFGYAAGRCSAVACHGGLQTPSWTAGELIDVSADCTGCHAAANQALPQYNSYFSGLRDGVNLHGFHLAGPKGFSITCTSCHSPSLLTAHFSGLATPAFEGNPADTLAASLNYRSSTGACTVSCHFDENGDNPDPNNVIFRWK